MEKTYLELVRRIRDGVREKAQEIPKFSDEGNGVIRILAYPCCKEADDWFGGLSNFAREYGKYIDPTDTVKVGVDDIVDYEYTFAIAPGGRRSGIDLKIPHLTEDYGYANHPGALCIKINTRMASIKSRNTGGADIESPFCLLYVCVSGADSKDDQKCALASIEVVREFFLNEGHFHLNIPNVSDEERSVRLTKRIGIIGVSYESTLHYYEQINRKVNERAGGLTSTDLVLRSVNFGTYYDLMNDVDWYLIEQTLSCEAEKLACVLGCDYVAIATNTMHKVAPAIKCSVEGWCHDDSSIYPRFVHIGDCIAEKLREVGAKRILFLGIKFTMTEDFMKTLLGTHDIEVMDTSNYPEEIDEINRIIFDELCHGIVTPESKEFMMNSIYQFLADSVLRPDAIVLGCTELNMILKPDDVDIPLIDSTQAHIDKLVELCLS